MRGSLAPQIYVTVRDTAGNEERVLEQSYRVKGLEYTDSPSKADRAVLTVDNSDLSNLDDPIWAHRNLLVLTWGYPGRLTPRRELVITKVSGFLDLKVEARAKSVLMDAVKRSRVFRNMTRSEVVAQIAEENGYGNNVAFIDSTSTRYETISQPNISDAQLLRRLAHKQGFDFYVDHVGLHWKEERLVQTPKLAFVYHTDPGEGNIESLSIEQDITRRPTVVRKVTRDPLEKRTVESTASDAEDSNREGVASVLLVKAPDLKSGALALSYEEESVPAGDHADVQREAQVKYRRGQRSAVKMSFRAIGEPYLYAKSLITVSGIGRRLSGNYYVEEVKHSVGPGDYNVSVKVRSDGTGAATKRRQSSAEVGLPEVAPRPSRAKRTDEQAVKVPPGPNASTSPEELVPVPILDANGNEIGTGWKPRGDVDVTLKDGKAVQQ